MGLVDKGSVAIDRPTGNPSGSTIAPARIRQTHTFAVDARSLRRVGLARIARQTYGGAALALSDLDQAATARDLTGAEPELLLLGLGAGDEPESVIPAARWLARILVVVLDPGHHEMARRAMDAGADGYLFSNAVDATTLAVAVDDAHSGRRPPFASELPEGLGEVGKSPVTERVRQVLTLIAEGLHDDEVAQRLGISTSSVRKHIAVAQQRLAARTRTQAVAVAARKGLL